jgi:hypothetical protein
MLDGLMRRIYNEVKSASGALKEPSPPIDIIVEKLEPEVPVKPVKKARKKAQKPGQVALDWGDGQ